MFSLLNGGFESGFHKVDKELHPSLYQVKGKKRPVMHEVTFFYILMTTNDL